MKINNKKFKVWLSHLYAETYPKTKTLLNDKNGFCCLGVGCKLFVPIKKLEIKDNFIEGTVPAHQLFAPTWLKKINGDFQQKTTITPASLNDGTNMYCEFTHPEIAMLLQLVYIHKILD